MGDLTNDFSWSDSKGRRFRECRRKFWLANYGTWGGWDRSAPERARTLYQLKHLTGRQGWAGKTVHGVSVETLRRRGAGRTVELKEVIAATHRQMRDEYRASESGLYRQNPKHIVGLMEHHYDWQLGPEKWAENWEHTKRCIRNLYDAPALEAAVKVGRAQWRAMENLDSHVVDGIKVWAVLDLAFDDPDGMLEIVDWKTGRAKPEDLKQIDGYAAYAGTKWGLGPEQIRCRLVYLAGDGPEEVVTEATAESIAAWRQSVVDGAELVTERLVDQNRERNEAPEERFSMTDDESRCRYCEYRSDCGR